MILADTLPLEPQSLFNFLAGCCLIVVITEKVINITRKGPLETKEVERYVSKESYHRHCEINRDEHKRIEEIADEKISDLSAQHHQLAREVSDVNRLAETTEARLIQIDSKLENILRHLPKSRA